MSNADSPITVESDDRVTTVVIDRTHAMNAVNTAVLVALADAIDAADSRVVVLTGAGDRAFVSGGDITEFRERSGRWFQESFRDAMRDVEAAIEGNHAPVIAAVNGLALGGGTEIALMCDLVIAAERARFGLPEIGLGLIPGSGGTQRLTHLVGYLKAKELVLTGKQVTATEAAAMGLVNEAVPDDEFEGYVSDLADELADGPRLAQRFAKEAINRTRPNFEAGLELEAALAALLFETADSEEGFTAFVEKRDPVFE